MASKKRERPPKQHRLLEKVADGDSNFARALGSVGEPWARPQRLAGPAMTCTEQHARRRLMAALRIDGGERACWPGPCWVLRPRLALRRPLADFHTRERGLQALTLWLGRKQEVGELELLRLWKGIFYCFWHSDKQQVQAALADRLSEMLLQLPEQVRAGAARPLARPPVRARHMNCCQPGAIHGLGQELLRCTALPPKQNCAPCLGRKPCRRRRCAAPAAGGAALLRRLHRHAAPRVVHD